MFVQDEVLIFNINWFSFYFYFTIIIVKYLTQLIYLDLLANDFIGEIPSSFSNLKELSPLSLGDNYLNGTIPLSLSNLKELSYLDLQGNNLSGKIPSSLSNLSFN